MSSTGTTKGLNIQTLVSRLWASDRIDIEQAGSLLDAWFKVSSENPRIMVEAWQVVACGIALESCFVYVQVMLPDSAWRENETDPSTFGSS